MWRRWTSGLVGVLVVAGCGGRPAPQATAPPPPPVTPSVSEAPSSEAPPSEAPSSEAPAPDRTAADGSRLAACADGDCEVVVTKPVTIKLRTGTLKVKKVSKREAVEIDLTLRSGGGGSGTLKGTCGTINYFFQGGGGRGEFCSSATAAPEEPTPVKGEVALQLTGWTAEGDAVLRVVTG